VQHLERDRLTGREVDGPEHLTHAASTGQLLDTEPTVDEITGGDAVVSWLPAGPEGATEGDLAIIDLDGRRKRRRAST